MNRNYNLLLVEDNPGDADWIRERLSEISDYDYRISHVDTVREADQILSQHHVDAVLLDLNLPDSRGTSTLEWARRISDKVAVTVLTGTDDEDLRLSAYHEGAQEYVVKGGTQAKLLSHIIVYGIERHQAKQQKRQLERIVAANPDAMIVADAAGEVLFVNDAALTLFGRTHEEFTSGRLAFPVQEGRITEFEIVRPDGKRYGEINMVPFQWGGRRVFLAAIRDITEKRQLTENLRETQKLEAIGTLAGGIAHDFNNLLAIITGNAQLALADTALSDSVRESLREIDRTANRATDLVRQILSFSRREETKLVAIRPEEVVADSVQFLRATVPERIAVRSEFEPDLPAIRADATQIQQVVMNLGTNAVHAMSRGRGEISISLARRRLGAADRARFPQLDSGDYVELTVRDTGEGIPPDKVDRIFEPFFTTKPKGKGTGLGLAVVHGIVCNHGGLITVESEVGHGAVFRVLLPATQDDAVGSAPVSVPVKPGRGRCVLFVDDERQLVVLVKRMLERLDYRVSGVSSSTEALELFRSRPGEFDVLITDLSMPDMDGPELIHQVRQIRPDLPVILATGFLPPEDLETTRKLDVFEVVAKPGGLTDLGRVLQRLFERPS